MTLRSGRGGVGGSGPNGHVVEDEMMEIAREISVWREPKGMFRRRRRMWVMMVMGEGSEEGTAGAEG